MKQGRIRFLSVIVIMALAFLLIFGLISKLKSDAEAVSYREYKRHYVLITDSEDSDFWDKVYESAEEAGKNSDAYVERFGENLSVQYDRKTLLKMAIQAQVDGIIFSGDESQETRDLINEAVDQGIPVVTVLNDCSSSNRQCYVGTGNYTLGQEYGEQIEKLLAGVDGISVDNPAEVLVLTDKEYLEVSQNLILMGIRECLEDSTKSNEVKVETKLINNTGEFSSEEAIRDIFLDEEDLPNIIVCLSELSTKCAYQAAVDYNKVGSVKICGLYDSQSILEGVSKGIISATLTIDTDQVGTYCVQALNEYLSTGYTNGYMAVDTHLITEKEAEKILEDREAADDENE